MGSLGLPAIAMAVRSAFALLCFALLCGLAASSAAVQSETETELKEGEAAGNQVLVEQALESRVVRGSNRRERIRKACEGDINPKRCERQKNQRQKQSNEEKTQEGREPLQKRQNLRGMQEAERQKQAKEGKNSPET